MKRCPTCQRDYGDESLNYCLDDGATLLHLNDSASSCDSGATLILDNRTVSVDAVPPTQISTPRGAQTELMPPTMVTAPPETPRYTAPDANITPPPPKSKSHLLTAGVTAIAVLLLVLVGIGIAMLIRGTGSNQSGANNTSNVANGDSSSTAKTDNSSSKANANNQNATVPPDGSDNNSAGSFIITASASSTRAPLKAFSYAPANALDNNLMTAWIEGVSGPGIGEWIRCDFNREVKLNYVLMTPGYFKTAALWKQNNRLAAATLHFSDGTSQHFTFPDQMQKQKLTVNVRTRFVRLVIDEFYPGSVDSEDTPISEMSFDWEP